MSGTEALQAAFSDLVLDSDIAAFRQDPIGFAASRGLDPGDARAMQRWQRRLLTYRALVRFALSDPLPDCFPITKALLGEDWDTCVAAFLDSRTIQSPYYRHIHPHFVEWLAASRWGEDRWPCLLSLAHFEYLELEVLRAPEDEAEAQASSPTPESRVRFSGSARNLAYPWRIHETTDDAPEPAEGTALLFCHRLPDGRYHQRELDGPESAFLTRVMADAPIRNAAEAVELDLQEALNLLADLHAEGAVLGYR